jgi:hypothetical protein
MLEHGDHESLRRVGADASQRAVDQRLDDLRVDVAPPRI